MRELLLKQKMFKVTTPLGTRDIEFSENFQDVEFDSWDIVDGREKMLYLSKDGEVLARLKYDNKNLSGFDVRGGKTEITPLSSNKKKFVDHFRLPRRSKGLTPVGTTRIMNIEKKSDMAVISKTPQAGYDTYWEDYTMHEMYTQLFEAGYKYVVNLNCDTTPHYLPLLVSLSNQLGMQGGSEIGSVQLVSGTSGDAADIQFEHGDFKGFLINHLTWAKVKTQTAKTQLNFYANLKAAFDKHHIKRYSTVMSRDRDWTPQDSRRKNFNLKEN